MKSNLIVLFLLGAVTVSIAQKHDYNWLIGASTSIPQPDSIWGINEIDFNISPPHLGWQMRQILLQDAAAVVSNKEGKLQFYTDAMQVFNWADQMMSNGDNLSPGAVRDEWAPTGLYPSLNGTIILNVPTQDSTYCMLHVPLNQGGFQAPYFDGLLYSTIDMGVHNGLGEVTAKNIRLTSDTLSGGGITACKHANGRDWWIVAREAGTNCFLVYILTPNGIDTVGKQCIGDTIHKGTDRGYGIFSPDGSKYVWSNPFEGLKMLDFDRCNGEFSNYLHIEVEDSLTVALGSVFLHGVAVSPNSRYLYLSSFSQIRQYDLWAANIVQSEVQIANLWVDSPSTSATFSRLAPDGKIYLVHFGSDTFLHVIHNPDVGGMGCNFEKNGFELFSKNNAYLPNYPNYRLGSLTGSACDTVQTGITNLSSEVAISIFPNPANTIITIDYGYLAWANGDATLEVYNLAGQLQYSQALPRYTALQKLNIQVWPSGMYQAVIKQGGAVTAKGRWVKE